MKGELIIRNEVKPLKLEDFKQEAFLFQSCIHMTLYDPENIKKGKGIPCFCVNIPGIVFLDPKSEIEPIDLEIIAK